MSAIFKWGAVAPLFTSEPKQGGSQGRVACSLATRLSERGFGERRPLTALRAEATWAEIWGGHDPDNGY